MTESWETEYVQLLFNIFWTWISWCFTSSEGLRCIQREGWLAEIPGIWACKVSVIHSSPFCSECWMPLAEDLLWGMMLWFSWICFYSWLFSMGRPGSSSPGSCAVFSSFPSLGCDACMVSSTILSASPPGAVHAELQDCHRKINKKFFYQWILQLLQK